jgi:Aspartyl protease
MKRRRMPIGRTTATIFGLLAIAWGVWASQKGAPETEHRIAFQARNGLIYIPAEVNGHNVTLLLDTGAGATTFSKTIAPPNNLDSMVKVNLASGSIFGFRIPVAFTLGRANLKDEHCVFRQDVVVGDFKFDGADGAIGLDVLRSFKAVTLDFENSVLVLEDR